MSCRQSAIDSAFAGRLAEAVDIYRGVVEENGYLDGILHTVARGLLGCPQTFHQGTPEMRAALLDASGTAGDDRVMHPPAECIKVFKDGVGFGIGLGQYVLTCWRCRSTEWDRCDVNGQSYEVCRRCDAWRLDRPVGVRELFALKWRDPRWLWRNLWTSQWYYIARNGTFPVNPGDGEWFMFRTVPDLDAQRHGPWLWATIAAIFGRDSAYDRQAVSAMSAPKLIFQAKGPTAPGTREEAARQLDEIAFQAKLMMPGEWEAKILEAANRYHDVATGILEWAVGMFEVGITGNQMGMQARSAFTDANVYNRTTREHRAFFAECWAEQKRNQGIVWWGLDNYGTRDVPLSFYDTRSPEDKAAEARAITERGNGYDALARGLAAHGLEVEPDDIIEQMQRLGVRVRAKGKGDAGKLPLGVDAAAALIKGDEGRAGLGLAPFGDDRGDKTIGELQEEAPPMPATRPRRRSKR